MSAAVGVRVQDSVTNQAFDRVFSRLPVRIGRNALNDLQLDHQFVSQFHAVLDVQGGQLILRDLGSTNGTLLKGGRVPTNQSVQLADHGFEFAILNLVFRTYSVAEEAPAPSVPQRPLAATMMFKEAHADALRDHVLVRKLAPRVAAMREPIEAAQNSIETLIGLTASSLKDLPPETHGGFVRQIVARLPSIEHEPRFRALLADHRVQLHQDPKTSPQELALQAVREMAIHYLPSVGAPTNAADVAQFITKLNETINVFLKCFVPLKDGHRQFEADLALRQPQQAQRSPADTQVAVENARDTNELALRLLDWRDNSFEASRAVESVFADIMIHQVAMLNGVMMGVKSLLDELSPAQIERVANEPRHKAGLLQGHHRALWKVYEQRHADLADDQKRLFSVLFGREFGQAYRGLAGGEQRTQADGPGQTPPPEGVAGPANNRARGPGYR